MSTAYRQHDTFDEEVSGRVPRRESAARPWLIGAAGAALLGALFAGVSTADFIEHLDRQVHSIHCSFIPGAGQQIGESGCRAVMMSPYSSMFRTWLWGGLPISLLALAVFAYLVYRSVDLALRDRITTRQTGFLVTAMLLPVAVSAIYGYVAAVEVGALCKLCTGIYVSSGAGLLCAFVAHRNADRNPAAPPAPYGRWFVEGVVYVAVLTAIYLAFAPKSDKSLAGCGGLVRKDDPHRVMIPLGGGATQAIAVLDPLCPACKSFEDRLDASGLRESLDLQAVLFPLDSTCNWMVKSSLHPGACAVSEAILCDPQNARRILSWAFDNQKQLMDEARGDEKKLRERLLREFSGVKGCLGGPNVKNKLNKSLRWVVANALPVLTPQLFIGDRRVCDEDTDLGLEYTIAGMIEQGTGRKAGGR